MKAPIAPLSVNESSMRVNLLHKALDTLGFPVAEGEQQSHTAGESTLQQVRALQAKLTISFDDQYVVDETTYQAIKAEMTKNGELAKSNSFTVKGTVYGAGGAIIRGQQVIALDVDLRGAAVYRGVKTIQEVKENGGFEFLGEKRSDSDGNYHIEFFSFQFARAERKKADVIVYAVNKDGAILGSSRLVNSEDYSSKGEARNIDVQVTVTDNRTEYAILMEKLQPFLEESKVGLAELSLSHDQVLFSASELDEPAANIQASTDAESLRTTRQTSGQPGNTTGNSFESCISLNHELLYGIGRQNIPLTWLAIFGKTNAQLTSAIQASAGSNIIKKYDEKEVQSFLQLLHGCTVANTLQSGGQDTDHSVQQLLSLSLPQQGQQEAFIDAYRSFRSQSAGDDTIDYKKFWSEYLLNVKEFKDNPALIPSILFSHQLSVISGNFLPVMNEIQVNRKISSVSDLLSIGANDWKGIIQKTGTPDFVPGANDDEKIAAYAAHLQALLNSAFPTQKIALMLKNRELPVKDAGVSEIILSFLNKNTGFEIGSSPVHEYADEIKAVARDRYNEVKSEMNRMQRVFQVSPRPEVMSVLMTKNLDSAYSIASIPRSNFIQMHGQDLGGDLVAESVYQRAQHISNLAAERAMKMYDLSHLAAPALVYSASDRSAALTVLQSQVSKRHNPDYAEIFGSPDICECTECRSVYSAAAYFVDLLRFIWRGVPNTDGKSPLDMLVKRRPDLLFIPLTCENTNTLVPYIDLVNEIMEYYTYHGLLDKNAAYDTGETTADELRASPQHFEPEAYRILKNAVYPFSLPYHQPLFVIRTYSDFLKTARYEIMKGMQKDFSAPAAKAIESEALRIAEEEYRVLTLKNFSGGPDLDDLNMAMPKPNRQLQQYYGFPFSAAVNPELDPAVIANLEKVAGTGIPDGIHEFLRRTGITYTDLVELIKTKFINPFQQVLAFLEQLFSQSTLTAPTIYSRLQQIKAGTLDPAADPDIMPLIAGKILPADFKIWVRKHFDDFNAVITLYQFKSLCDLNTTYLKTVKNVYAADPSSGIDNATWSKIHRFIRLWRKLGWNIHETDLLLEALGESDITDITINKLSYAVLLNRQLKLPVNKLATIWGSIDRYGDQSLYKKLFLNKAVQKIDTVFQADAFGNYLSDTTILLQDHISAILAAFRMSEDDLNAIADVVRVTDNGTDRAFNLATEKLNIYNLSIIYRYTILAKALKIKVPDFCLLTRLFNNNPFSVLSIPALAMPPVDPVFTSTLPSNTFEFYKLAVSVKSTSFKAQVLQYIFSGVLAPESNIGLNPDKIKQSARDIRDAFTVIEQSYPAVPVTPLTADSLQIILSLSFKADIVSQLIGIIGTQQTFSVQTDTGLAVAIPPLLAAKYNYVALTGTLTSLGIMPDADRITLRSLAVANENYSNAVNALYIQSKTVASGSPAYSVITDANLGVTIPDELSPKFTYTKASGRLSCIGVMSDTEKTALKVLPGFTANFQGAVEEIYAMPEKFIRDNFSGVFASANAILPNADFITLLNHPAQPAEKKQAEKIQFVYSNYLPLLKQKLHEDVIVQHIATLVGLSHEATSVLISNDLSSLIGAIATEGFSADYFPNATFTAPASVNRTDSEINFDWGAGFPDPMIPSDNFSVRWQSYISPNSSGEYTLVVTVKESDELFNLYLDDALIVQKPAADPRLSWEVIVSLNASQMHKLVVEYAEKTGNAGITLSWKTATTAVDIIHSGSAYPVSLIDGFIASVTTWHRAGKFIAGFKLTDTEVNHLVRYNADFGNINFKAIMPVHWQRIVNYVTLRNALPQGQALLTDVFAAANITNPIPTVNSLVSVLYLATAWDMNALIYFVNTYYTLSLNDFKNEIALRNIFIAISFVNTTGLSPQTLVQWAVPETDFDKLNAIADLVKSTVKAKYEEEDWFSLAGSLSDKIRESQKQALISYLLTRQELLDWGARDADGLFEYFLIDVQMGSCMDTSRIVQATAAVQMFINRCLLNLESVKVAGLEKGVSPDGIGKDRWEWMKYYRVWEVNRKIFLYPENWLEPEWRDDRSPFFKDLESELTQNDITTGSVENAFRNYLANLNTVANLNVCGMYQEIYPNGSLRLLHVFGRTHNGPYQFFYRTCNEFFIWSAWEKVQLDIRMTEDGDNSGVHLLPVVWKNRLFVFWLEFIKKQETNTVKNKGGSDATFEDMSKLPPSNIKPNEYYEVRLAWSEYVNGKWNSKQLTKEFIKSPTSYPGLLADIGIQIDILSDNELIIWVQDTSRIFGNYSLADIQSEISGWTYNGSAKFTVTDYAGSYMLYKKYGVLDFKGETYLQNSTYHKILFSSKVFDFATTLNYPFFYQAYNRTYFVRSYDVKIWDYVRDPGLYASPILDRIKDNYYKQQVVQPVGPDDYIPQPDTFTFNDSIKYTTDNKYAKRLPNAVPVKTLMENVSVDYSVEAMKTQMNMSSGAQLNMAFSDKFIGYEYYRGYHMEKGLEFHTFYHPFSSQYVTNLNNFGIDGLMNTDTFLNILLQPFFNDYGTVFTTGYNPNFSQGLVRKAPALNDYVAGAPYTYYKENICFDLFGANSIYNWELFFHAPLYIATRLSKNGKYEEALKWFHYIFDPTSDAFTVPGQSETSRFWNVLPFKTTPAQTLEDWFNTIGLGPNSNPAAENSVVAQWRNNPFKPFVIARNRPIAFMKNVVIKYVENLREWGDSLFRMFTRESVNEALQLYVMASHILGPKPEFVPKRGEIKAETYDSLKNKWDDFSNALVELENIFPYSSSVPPSGGGTNPSILGIGPSLYFCIPSNDVLMGHWDTVADRLYKIRHCMDIDGVERQLALFSPPIDPAMLINAAAQGISLGSILADLSSPPPIYRFTYLIQKANEFCGEVRALGGSLLAALEKKDGEEMARLRASQETNMLNLMTAIKERQVLDSRASHDGLLKARATAEFKLSHYNALISTEAVTVPAVPAIDAGLTVDSQLPPDTSIPEIASGVDGSLVDSDTSGVKIINKEKEDLDKANDAMISQQVATGLEGLAGVLHLIPQFNAHGTPLGVGVAAGFGGVQLGGGASVLAKIPAIIGAVYSFQAAQASKMASFIRREQEWTFQANLAAKEIIQLDKQITSAEIKTQIAEKELSNHMQQIENAKQVEQFLQDKFTGQELYQWMKEQLFAVYKQAFNMAYDMAKKVEKCYQYEIGNMVTSFIQYGYWENNMQGLCSGEKLQLALRQLETAYIEENKRELELNKSISLALLNPLALQELRATGKCFVPIPEELFDMDYAGHYFRRIKSVSLSLPCIAGPYTTVNCTLRLLKNTVRINTLMNDDGNYEHNNDEGAWTDDDRFRESNVPVRSIATSTGQRDTGMFELNFRDDRYLPFEGAGAISQWKIELNQDADLRLFDYATISDIIFHINYTAREDAGLFRDNCVIHLKDFLVNAADLSTEPLLRMFSLKHEFSTEWHKFLYPVVAGTDQQLRVTIKKEQFPFFTQNRSIAVSKVEVLLKANRTGDYKMVLAATDLSDNPMTSAEIAMPENATFAGMQKGTITATTPGLNAEDLNILSALTFKFKNIADADFHSIDPDPEEISDLFLVVHYKLGDVI